jgi:CRISPR-associated protein Csb2
LGYAGTENATRAASIYQTLAGCLDGEEIEPGYRLQLMGDSPHRDKVWWLYAGSSRVWLSVTPVVINRGYKVPTCSSDGTPLSANERHHRRSAEWTSLLRTSLRHISLPDDMVTACEITITPSPLVAATERAERYRPNGDGAAFVHVRIDFRRPVRGPLIVGDRRYIGLGLLSPVAERS